MPTCADVVLVIRSNHRLSSVGLYQRNDEKNSLFGVKAKQWRKAYDRKFNRSVISHDADMEGSLGNALGQQEGCDRSVGKAAKQVTLNALSAVYFANHVTAPVSQQTIVSKTIHKITILCSA
ncbi:hypothetical protein Tcan_00711, partial [Toxocara canis]